MKGTHERAVPYVQAQRHLPNEQVHGFSQCPPVTVNQHRRKSSAKSFSIATAASNGMGFRWATGESREFRANTNQ
jgi:hypothetical protein